MDEVTNHPKSLVLTYDKNAGQDIKNSKYIR